MLFKDVQCPLLSLGELAPTVLRKVLTLLKNQTVQPNGVRHQKNPRFQVAGKTLPHLQRYLPKVLRDQ